ncbi:MAG: CHASE3 domain-containing protein [Planctomycetaceae bacterium]|nr:CHASE3 domain-containing protein [Planctomycetaceae bacterium]
MRIRTKIAGSLAVALVAIAILGIAFGVTVKRYVSATRQVTRSVNVMRYLEEALSDFNVAEACQKGYLLTGDQEYLSVFEKKAREVPEDLDRVAEHLRNDALQEERLGRLGEMLRTRVAMLSRSIELARQGQREGAISMVKSGRGRELSGVIHALVEEIEDRENQIMEERSAQAARLATQVLWSMIAGIPLLVLVMALGVVLLTRNITGPLELLTRAADEIGRGQIGLSPTRQDGNGRTDEIGVLQASFARMSMLLDSERRLRLAQQAGRVGTFEWNIQTGMNTWTEDLEAIHGLQPGQFGKTEESWEQLVYEEDRLAAIAVVNHALETGAATEGEWRVKWPDGSIHWVIGRFQAARDAEGRLLSLTGVNIDITARKQMEQELEQTNRMLQMLGECNEAVIRIDDMQQLTTEICRIAVEVGGYMMAWVGMARDDPAKSVEPVAWTGFEDGYVSKAHITWADEDRGRGPVGTAIRTGQVQIGQDFLTDPHLDPWREEALKRGYRSVIALPLRQEQTVIGALAIYGSEPAIFTEAQAQVLREIAEDLALGINAQRMRSALRAANERLTAYASQLQALAGELTLTEQRERRRFATLLHDHLQQLLVGAKFRIAILGRTHDPVIREGVKEVEALLDESIKASRSLTAELSPPILQQGGLAEGLEWLARWMSDKHGLFVELSLQHEASPTDQGVKTFLFEAVRELLFNAVKHSGTKAAAVSLRRLTDNLIQIVVSDQGHGFDPAGVTPAGPAGGGFGLFSIRERLSLIGGQFEIDSAPGKGSRFSLTAPAAAAAAAPADRAAAKASIAAPTAAHEKTRLMLVDDHTVMRQGLAALLADEAQIEIVAQAADGRQAVDLADELQPDVILMDVSLPQLSGIEATRIIHQRHPQIRIIGLSMFEGPEQSQAMRDAGAYAYLTKSGPIDELIRTILP